MSKKNQVILLEDVTPLGLAGQIVTVAEGYARNFLFPQGKAALATAQAVTAAKEKDNQKKAVAEKQLSELQTRAEALQSTELTVPAKVKDGDEIYGSINATHIAKQLSQQSGHPFKTKDIGLVKPLTTLGSHQITVSLSPEVETTIHINVIPEEAPTAADDAQTSQTS